MTTGDRIKEVRKTMTPKMAQVAYGESLGISRDAVNNLENNRVEPSDAILKLIAMTYSINYEWLKTGEGEMYAPKANGIVPELLDALQTYPAVLSLLESVVGRMTDADWKRINELVEDIVGKKA